MDDDEIIDRLRKNYTGTALIAADRIEELLWELSVAREEEPDADDVWGRD